MTAPQEEVLATRPEVILDPASVLIDLHSVRNRVVVSEDHSLEELHSALRIGRAVVFPDYTAQSDRIRLHEAYPGRTVDQRRSAHQVTFGRVLGYNPSKGRVSTICGVAMKPFTPGYGQKKEISSASKALQEALGYQTLRGLNIETFDPIGVYPAQDRVSYVVLTRLRPGLESLDVDEWVVGRQIVDAHTAEVAARNNKTVREIAEVFAYAHANGVYLPDGQIKNWAVSENGSIGAIDTENMRVIDPTDEDAATHAWQNLSKLAKSLVLQPETEDTVDGVYSVGMLYGLSPNDIRRSIEELVITPYLEMLEKLDGTVDPEVITNLGVMVLHNFEQSPDWPALYGVAPG